MLLPAVLGASWLVAERAKSRVRRLDYVPLNAGAGCTPLPPPQSPNCLSPIDAPNSDMRQELVIPAVMQE
jgi:hypothetical protein